VGTRSYKLAAKHVAKTVKRADYKGKQMGPFLSILWAKQDTFGTTDRNSNV
jgi:hypothetical protein